MDRDTSATVTPDDTGATEPAGADTPTRPRTRGECVDGPRPCPWVSCTHHLLLGRLTRSRCGITPEREGAGGEVVSAGRDMTDAECLTWLERSGHTCALDVADDGCATLDVVGAIYGLTKERVRQIEVKAMRAVRPKARHASLREYLEDIEDRDEDGDHDRSGGRASHRHTRAAPAEIRQQPPPPATWNGPTHPSQVRTPSESFWCGRIGSVMPATLCTARHRARSVVGAYPLPVYRGCAECHDGAELAARLGDVPAYVPDARRHLPVLRAEAPAPAPEPVLVRTIAWFGDDDAPSSPNPQPDEAPVNNTDSEIAETSTPEPPTDHQVDPPETEDAPICVVGPCRHPRAKIRVDTIKALRGCCRECRRRGAYLLKAGTAKGSTVVALLGETYWRTESGAALQPVVPPKTTAAPMTSQHIEAPPRAATPVAPSTAPTAGLSPSMLTELREARRALALARSVGGVAALEAILAELEAMRG